MAPLDPNADAGDSQNLHETSAGGGNNDEGHGNGANGGSVTNGTLATIDTQLPSVPTLNWSYGPPSRPEILSAKPNPIELLHAVRRRWTLATGLGVLLGAIAAAAVWFLLPIQYDAYALVKISGKPSFVLDPVNSAHEDFAVYKRTQVQLILSNVVLNGTLREPTISRLSIVQENDGDPVSWLKNQLSITYPDDAEIMRISMRGKKRNEITKIVDKVVEVYMKEIVQRDKQMQLENEAKLRRAFEKQSADYQSELEALRTLEQIHKTSGSEAAQLKKRMAIDELGARVDTRNNLRRMLSETNRDIKLLEAHEQNPNPEPPSDAVVDMQVANDPLINQMTQKIVGLNEYLSQIRSLAKDPESMDRVREIKRQIVQTEENIDDRKAELRPKVISMLGSMNNDGLGNRFPLSVENLRHQSAYLQEQLAVEEKRVHEMTEQVAGLESFSARVAAKQEEISQMREIKNRLGAELDRITVERLAPERITPIDNAVVANGSGDASRKYVAVAFAGLFSFGVIVLGVAFLEFQSRKVNSVKEVNDGLGIRVVGELPSITGRAFRRVRGGKGQNVLKALMAERIDGTRTALIHTTTIDPPRVVMITSAKPHEGKTTTSSQLAASLARSGRRTLLVDADIRSPGIHRVFEMPQDPGLCELLRGEADRDAVIHPTRTANLWLMPAGRCDLRSVQALSSSYLGTAIGALAVQFDYIIIDSGPVLKVADPLLVGQHVDAVIVSVLRDVSRVPDVYEAVERLRSVGITVLGSVVNGVKDDVARHGVELLMAETPTKAEAETTSTT